MRITDETGVQVVETATDSNFVSEGAAWHQARNIGDTTTICLVIEPKQR